MKQGSFLVVRIATLDSGTHKGTRSLGWKYPVTFSSDTLFLQEEKIRLENAKSELERQNRDTEMANARRVMTMASVSCLCI